MDVCAGPVHVAAEKRAALGDKGHGLLHRRDAVFFEFLAVVQQELRAGYCESKATVRPERGSEPAVYAEILDPAGLS